MTLLPSLIIARVDDAGVAGERAARQELDLMSAQGSGPGWLPSYKGFDVQNSFRSFRNIPKTSWVLFQSDFNSVSVSV